MSESRAIQTKYNGYYFRSRLEARWAIFLDRMNIAYNYESEGFELDGLRYLPDFHLKDGIQLYGEEKRLHNVWVEIKYSMDLEEGDWKKISRFVQKTGNVILLVTGDPGPDAEMRLISHAADGSGWATPFVRWMQLQNGQAVLLKLEGQAVDANLRTAVDPLTRTNKLMAAYSAAREARFEFGESPGNRSVNVPRTCRRCGRFFVPQMEHHQLCYGCFLEEKRSKQTTVTAVTAATAMPKRAEKRAAWPGWAYGIMASAALMILLFAGLGAMADDRNPDQAAVAARDSNSDGSPLAGQAALTETVPATEIPVQGEPSKEELAAERSGFVAIDYAEGSEESAATSVLTDTPEPTSTTAPTWTAEPTKVPTSTIAPTNTPQPTSVPTRVEPLVRVNAASVNLRNGPGTNYGIIDVGLQADEYEVIGKTTDGSWFNVAAKNGLKFWVASSVVNEIVSGSTSRVGIVSTIPAAPPPTLAPQPTATSIPPTVIAPVATLAPAEAPPVSAPDAAPSTSCCKVCRKGKACGNSCIRQSYTCHKPPGCACNASIDTGIAVAFFLTVAQN